VPRNRALPALIGIALLLVAAPATAAIRSLSPAAASAARFGTQEAQATEPTDLVVQVRNEAGAPVAGQDIFVVVSNGAEVTDELTGTTSESGDVRFDDIAVGAGYTARPIAVSEGFPYQGDRITLTPGVESILPLTIASLSDTPANLHIDVLHIILNVVQPGVYQALQVMTVLNVDQRAAYSGETYNGQPVGLVIPLPDGASSVQPLPPEVSGIDPSRLVQDGNRMLDLRPVPPGNHQIAIQYEIVTDPDGGDVSITVPHPTSQVSLLLGPDNGVVTIDSDQLRELEPADIPGQGQYANFASDVLAAGDTLSFFIGPLQPGISVEAWSMLGLALALLAAAVASFVFAGRQVIDPAERHRLLAEIARIDDLHGAGDLSDADYHARRLAALGRLMEIDGTVAPDASGD